MSASRLSIAEDLWCYHEAATADWILHCSEDEFVRVCDVADFLTFEGPALRSGASMMIAKAFALAAIYIREGVPRDLVRSRRDLTQIGDSGPRDERWPDYELQNARPAWFAVGDDAIAFWAPDPARAKQGRTRRKEVFQAQAIM